MHADDELAEDRGETPALKSVLAFMPDSRYSAIRFEGYRGDDKPSVHLTLRFIGWAVVVDWIKDGRYGTRVEPVAVTAAGEPILAHDIEQNYGIDEGRVLLRGLILAGEDTGPLSEDLG